MAAYQAITAPTMRGAGADLAATHEVHIFLGPLNPDAETVARYEAAVATFNAELPQAGLVAVRCAQMKACHLALVFRAPETGAETTVRVMQSAQYVWDDRQGNVAAWARLTADYFRSCGFEVLREKIEATAYGIVGVPRVAAEAAAHPGCYFEFHVSVARKEAAVADDLVVGAVSEAEVDELRAISRTFSAANRVPVPLSYNVSKQANQRYLNVRFRGAGIDEIRERVRALERQIVADSPFRVVKTISEYVWYDTMPQMDHGWIDYTPEETARFFPASATPLLPLAESAAVAAS